MVLQKSPAHQWADALDGQIEALRQCRNEFPRNLLGVHVDPDRVTRIRAYLPFAKRAWALLSGVERPVPMRNVNLSGVYQTELPSSLSTAKRNSLSRYRLRVETFEGKLLEMDDPQSFPPILSDFDLHLFGEGQLFEAYRSLGAHPRTVDGVVGVSFAVWAPNADAVGVVGDFNGWDGRAHPMQKRIPSGIWEIFVPGLKPGEKYKYRVNQGSHSVDKSDPFGFAAELPPRTASIVTDMAEFAWSDEKWIEQRASHDPLSAAISVYEVHLGSWKRTGSGTDAWLGYRELAHELVEYCQRMGYTHIELMPVSEHPFTGSWGYQTVGYFAATSRYGSPDDFKYFVNYCHEHNLGVILDWVPAHFPKDDHGLRRFDGTALFEHDDPRKGEHPDWGTLIFNYGRNEVRNFLISNALFWIDEYHIDGLRVDAVASMLYLDYSREGGDWIPNEFGGRENLEAISLLKQFNEVVHDRFPGVLTIAEESTAWPGVSRPTYDGGLGFSLKWNMGWMNDTLRYFNNDPVHRKFHHNELTFSLIYAFTENFMLPFSHDEVVHGKGSLLDQMPGDMWQRFANLRLLYSYMWTHPGKKLMFMGDEIAQWNEWNHDESLQWHLLQWDSHRGIQKMIEDLNRLYRTERALHEIDFHADGFEWIDCMSSETSVLAYRRKSRDPSDYVVVAANFTPVPRDNYHVGVPEAGYFEELFNSDAEIYGGSNQGNHPGRDTVHVPAQGHELSICVNLPPLGAAIFKPRR